MNFHNVVNFYTHRQTKDTFNHSFERKLHVTSSLIERIGLTHELKGHNSCVNCLQWDDTGDILVSGSDDLNILIWTPFLSEKAQIVPSGHRGNIFSVKFLPGSDRNSVVSGAADFKVRVNDFVAKVCTYNCFCHGGRIKRIATSPNTPFMFWSAAEDGIIKEFDVRQPHLCSNVCSNVLVNLINHLSCGAEAKCIEINPVNSNLLAVGANDPYVRLYDRRMIRPTVAKFAVDRQSSSFDVSSFIGESAEPGENNLFPGCVSYFVAGHLPLYFLEYKRKYRALSTTYLAFSPDGRELLANIGGEHIYLFDINQKRKQLIADVDPRSPNNILNINATASTSKSAASTSLSFASTSKSAASTSISAASTSQSAASTSQSDTRTSQSDARTSRLSRMDRPSTSSSGTSRSRSRSPSPSSRRKDSNREQEELPILVSDMQKRANQFFGNGNYAAAVELLSSGIKLCPDAPSLFADRAAAYFKREWDGDSYASIRDCITALQLRPLYSKAHFLLAECFLKLNMCKESFDCLQAFRYCFPHFSNNKSVDILNKEAIKATFAQMAEGEYMPRNNGPLKNIHHYHAPLPYELSTVEKGWRYNSYDYETRFCGHCNTTTDIKEANFFGSNGEYIIAGSDEGYIFIWEKETANIVKVIIGDKAIVNCVQPHPTTCMFAASGIHPAVRLWSPRPEDGTTNDREILDKYSAADANQRRMNADPLEIMLLNMGYRLPGALDQMPHEFSELLGD